MADKTTLHAMLIWHHWQRSLFWPALQVVELTSTAIHFLQSTFQDFDEDGDDCLSAAELEHMYDTAPELPWQQQPSVRVAHSQAGSLAWTRLASLMTGSCCTLAWSVVICLLFVWHAHMQSCPHMIRSV